MEKHIHGGDVYHHQGCIDFSANCNPLGTPEGIKKAIIESLEHINDYPQVGCTPIKLSLIHICMGKRGVCCRKTSYRH